jgi:hypothetical protein
MPTHVYSLPLAEVAQLLAEELIKGPPKCTCEVRSGVSSFFSASCIFVFPTGRCDLVRCLTTQLRDIPGAQW